VAAFVVVIVFEKIEKSHCYSPKLFYLFIIPKKWPRRFFQHCNLTQAGTVISRRGSSENAKKRSWALPLVCWGFARLQTLRITT
jgi:hypothetical protein